MVDYSSGWVRHSHQSLEYLPGARAGWEARSTQCWLAARSGRCTQQSPVEEECVVHCNVLKDWPRTFPPAKKAAARHPSSTYWKEDGKKSKCVNRWLGKTTSKCLMQCLGGPARLCSVRMWVTPVPAAAWSSLTPSIRDADSAKRKSYLIALLFLLWRNLSVFHCHLVPDSPLCFTLLFPRILLECRDERRYSLKLEKKIAWTCGYGRHVLESHVFARMESIPFFM